MRSSTSRKSCGPTALAVIAVVAVGLSTANAQMPGPHCSAPNVQVQGPAPAFFPDPTEQYAIEYIAIGEPFINCSTNKLRFVIKVPTMDPAGNNQVHPPPN